MSQGLRGQFLQIWIQHEEKPQKQLEINVRRKRGRKWQFVRENAIFEQFLCFDGNWTRVHFDCIWVKATVFQQKWTDFWLYTSVTLEKFGLQGCIPSMSQGLNPRFLRYPTVFQELGTYFYQINVGLQQFSRFFQKIYVKDLEYFAAVISWS